MIHHFFSIPLLMMLALYFMEFIFIVFVYIIRFKDDSSELTLKQKMYLIQTPFGLIKIIYIIAISDKISRKVKQTGIILSRMWSDAEDNNVKEEVSRSKC